MNQIIVPKIEYFADMQEAKKWAEVYDLRIGLPVPIPMYFSDRASADYWANETHYELWTVGRAAAGSRPHLKPFWHLRIGDPGEGGIYSQCIYCDCLETAIKKMEQWLWHADNRLEFRPLFPIRELQEESGQLLMF